MYQSIAIFFGTMDSPVHSEKAIVGVAMYLLLVNGSFSGFSYLISGRPLVFYYVVLNLVPRVPRLFGQRVGARRDSGEFEKI